MDNTPRPDRPNTTEIYEHYGAAGDYERIKSGEYAAVDFHIVREEDLREATANMAGFGTAKSQRIIIDYDKDYGWAMVKRILMDYRAKDVPAERS